MSPSRLPLPLLITGVAGVAGYNAFRYFHDKYPGQVVGTRRRDYWRLQGPGIAPCDGEDRTALNELFRRRRFRSVLNCIGNCKLKHCEYDPALAWRVNVESVENLLAAAEPYSPRIVHLSIDLVYSGTAGGGHVEDDPVDPVTVYGATMAAAESLLLSQRPDACIFRISLPMGVSFNGHAGAIDWIQSRFAAGRPATLYFDEIRTPHYTDCLNPLCETALGNDWSGIVHAGGPRPLSLYQIAQVVNRVGGYDPRLLQGIPRHEAGPMPPRAGDVSLNCDKLRGLLGFDPFDPWPLDDELAPTDRRWHHERPPGQEGSPQHLAELLYRNPRRQWPAADAAGS